jgi:hypothetical protein
VRGFVRAVVGVNLQKVSDLPCSAECWAYAIAFDGATVNSRSFLDVCVRFSAKDNIENVHLLAIPPGVFKYSKNSNSNFSLAPNSNTNRILRGAEYSRIFVQNSFMIKGVI